MANYTRKAILQTFDEMLHQMSFQKITVSAIVAKCEISSNTFYYHYKDIYDLLDAWMRMKKEQLTKDMDVTEDWVSWVKVVLHKMQDNSKLIHHVLDSISRERLERFIFCSVENRFYEYVKKRVEGTEVSDEIIRGLAGFCCYSFLGFLMKFIWEDMKVDVDSAVDRLSFIFAGIVESVEEKLREGDHDSQIANLFCQCSTEE